MALWGVAQCPNRIVSFLVIALKYLTITSINISKYFRNTYISVQCNKAVQLERRR
jgi:hypothetical protein